ncbi:3832_t:CDS:2 [Ambispora gerdemannii]|uniref:Guanylate kinase n=1 Tax=Ambispora gerdemannii TaxID=144530 RepID=A0A9N9GEF7_9GLOM|nr:3832_t:CDS:2 [Ambispora gerdemannii]
MSNVSQFAYRPVVIVVSGPSGSGKSTLLNKLFEEHPNKFGYSVSHTTRKPRPGEEDGKSYHFVTRDQFGQLINENAFIEHAEFSGNLYGTSVKAVRDVEDSGKICILDIELNGVKAVKRKRDELDAKFLFVSPPSLKILEERLRGRGTESEDAIKSRLEVANEELAYSQQEGAHDLIIVNDDLDTAYQNFKNFILDTYDRKFANI